MARRAAKGVRVPGYGFDFISFEPIVEPSRPDPAPDRLLRVQQVTEITRLHRSSIYRLEQAGDFPKRVRLTQNTVAWRESEVRAWIADRKRKAGGG